MLILLVLCNVDELLFAYMMPRNVLKSIIISEMGFLLFSFPDEFSVSTVSFLTSFSYLQIMWLGFICGVMFYID